jgi:glyceraldehyde 3-phosphate dehydrogenase
MPIKVGINGFGRIGRLVYRAAHASPNVDVVAVNDITDANTLAHLLKYDSAQGVWPEKVDVLKSGVVKAGADSFQVLAERDPAKLPWKKLGVNVVVESTGLFTKRELAAKHLEAGARKVIISAPSGEADATIVIGVNHKIYKKREHHIVSIASCTTNCLAPVVKVLHDNFQLERGLMTTIHAYTNDQRIADQPHKDLRRARSAAINIIPTSTGAARAIGLVMPELAGKLDGFAVRVPVPDGSLVDLVAQVKKPTTVEQINNAFKTAASRGPLKGILQYCEEPIVSSDIIGNPHSSIFDSKLTSVMGKTMVKVLSWYDNEWAYARRVADFLSMV